MVLKHKTKPLFHFWKPS